MASNHNLNPPSANEAVQDMPAEARAQLDADISEAGGEILPSEDQRDAVGRTMFDTPASEDNTVTVLLPQERIPQVPLQSLVRIKSGDKRSYLGIIVEGPFAEPDGLRADAPVVVTSTVHGAMFMPRFHGRARVELMGEEQGTSLMPPQFRPRPNSPVFLVDTEATARLLKVGGDIRLGLAVGYEGLEVGLESRSKNGIPRHLGILGTTGGGKSNTVATLMAGLQKAGYAVVLLDTEGEYTHASEPAIRPETRELLAKRGREPEGIGGTVIYHLVGRETTNPGHERVREFSPRFEELSPHAVMEILELTDAQQERFLQAYDAVKLVMADLGIFPRRDSRDEDERTRLEMDELESGYPRVTLGYVMDMVSAVLAKLDETLDDWRPFNFPSTGAEVIKRRANENVRAKNEISWRALMGKLARLNRMRIFDNGEARPLEYQHMLIPGRVSIVDLSDTDSPQVNNLVIAGVLRGLQRQQDAAYEAAKRQGKDPTPVAVIIEEAHEFLSDQRIRQMPVLFQQVARMVRRGRKRWLGLVFVTQLPQHLPDEVLGLINSYVLHKLSDATVISRLRRSVGNVDDALWKRLPGLSPGQAVITLATMSRPMLVSIDPAACRLGFEE